MLFVYITTSDRAEAERIGRSLVDQRLAACVNILEGMQSIYWWEGAIQTSEEAVLIAKTEDALFEKLMEAVKKMHSYSVPCIISFRIQKANPDYLQWLRDSVGA